MATSARPAADFEKYRFSVATPADNPEIIELLRKNPIHMEMDYVMDRHDDFFKVQNFLPGSLALIARNTATGEIAGCLSLLKLRGMLAGEEITFQYITDLIKSGQERSPLLMKKLLNHAFEHHFDTDFIFGLINAENRLARLFSISDVLHYQGKPIATFHYLELVPLGIQRLPKRCEIRPPESREDLTAALDFINEHYKNHLLFRPLDLPFFDKMCAELPGFSRPNIWMLFEGTVLKGAMICYDPAEIGSLVVAKMDGKTRFLLGGIRFIHRLTGLLFSPPREGKRIKTLQVRHLAGTAAAQNVLLRHANNMAYRQKLHSVSMLADERDAPRPANAVVYQYKSLMYAGYKPGFSEKIQVFGERPVFFDITFS